MKEQRPDQPVIRLLDRAPNFRPDRYERQESSQKTKENLTSAFNRVQFQ
jgi:hypothetical protein